MNIFYLHKNPEQCAKWHLDKHVVKMILEYAQLLCTVHRLCGNTDEQLYKSTHVKHPCVLWILKSNLHYKYVYDLFIAVSNEYTYRYNKTYISYTKLHNILENIPESLPKNIWIDPPCAMPMEYIKNNCIESYHEYYRKGKAHILKYTKRDIPFWLL